MSNNQDVKNVIKSLFPSKIYSYDILYDLQNIICQRLMLFKNSIDGFEKSRAEDYLEDIKSVLPKHANKSTEYLYRLYIISGVQFVSLCCFELSEKTIKNIISDLEIEFSLCDEFPVYSLEPNAVSTLYIFKNKELIFYENMYPSHISFIINELSSKNIVNYDLRWLS